MTLKIQIINITHKYNANRTNCLQAVQNWGKVYKARKRLLKTGFGLLKTGFGLFNTKVEIQIWQKNIKNLPERNRLAKSKDKKAKPYVYTETKKKQ